MSKAKEAALKVYPQKIEGDSRGSYDLNELNRQKFLLGYHQAEKDIKEELSKLFQEFMMDCINDNTDTHILYFIDVFNNKIKMIGNE